jgi:hypothetical protein
LFPGIVFCEKMTEGFLALVGKVRMTRELVVRINRKSLLIIERLDAAVSFISSSLS